MLALNIVAFIIESFIIIFTLNKIFEILFDIRSLIFVISLALAMFFMNLISLHFVFQVFFLTIIDSIYLFSIKHQLKNIYYIYSLCLLIILFFCRNLGNLSANFLSGVPTINFVKDEFAYASTFVAILFQMFLSFLFYYIVLDKTKIKNMNNIVLFSVSVFVLIAMFINLAESVIFSNFNIYTIYSLSIEFVILVICFISLYIKLTKQAKKSLEMSQQITRMQYQNQMYSLVSKVKDQLTNERHMMLYNYMNMKLLLAANHKKSLKEYIDKEIDKMMKYKYISSTGNALFDYTMTNKLNQLFAKNIDVKTVFMVSRNNILLDDENIVNYIIGCLDYSVSLNSKKIELFLNEYNEKYLLLKLMIYTDQSLDINKDQFLHRNMKKMKMNEENHYYEISVLLG